MADAGVPVAAGPLHRLAPPAPTRTGPAVPRTAPAAPAGPDSRPGSSAHPGRSPSAGWVSARCRTGPARRTPAASRLAEPSHTSTFCPASIAHPPSTTSRVAVRRFDGDGDVQRTISSIAVGSSAGSARSAAYWSGCSASASSPPATALRVVSAPALNSRLKNRYSSRSDSAGIGSSDGVGHHRQHVVGRARRAWPRSAPGRRCTSASRPPRRTAARSPPCASRRSRSWARSPRTANAVRIQALPAGCRSSASAVRRRRRPGSRTARPGSTRVQQRAAPGRADRPRRGRSSAASARS